jgi:hypothetical protein
MPAVREINETVAPENFNRSRDTNRSQGPTKTERARFQSIYLGSTFKFDNFDSARILKPIRGQDSERGGNHNGLGISVEFVGILVSRVEHLGVDENEWAVPVYFNGVFYADDSRERRSGIRISNFPANIETI